MLDTARCTGVHLGTNKYRSPKCDCQAVIEIFKAYISLMLKFIYISGECPILANSYFLI